MVSFTEFLLKEEEELSTADISRQMQALMNVPLKNRDEKWKANQKRLSLMSREIALSNDPFKDSRERFRSPLGLSNPEDSTPKNPKESLKWKPSGSVNELRWPRDEKGKPIRRMSPAKIYRKRVDRGAAATDAATKSIDSDNPEFISGRMRDEVAAWGRVLRAKRKLQKSKK